MRWTLWCISWVQLWHSPPSWLFSWPSQCTRWTKGNAYVEVTVVLGKWQQVLSVYCIWIKGLSFCVTTRVQCNIFSNFYSEFSGKYHFLSKNKGFKTLDFGWQTMLCYPWQLLNIINNNKLFYWQTILFNGDTQCVFVSADTDKNELPAPHSDRQ